MGHIAVFRAIDRSDVLQFVEVVAPGVGHAAGVVEVGLVQLFDVGGVAPEQVRVGPVLLHHLSLTFRSGFQSYDGLINLPRTRLDRLADCDPPC